MSKAPGLLQTSVGKKYVMAITGLILFGFVIGHLLGNLQVFAGPEKMNNYAAFLQGLGPALWAVRAFLLIVFLSHVGVAIRLTRENRKARPVPYKRFETHVASYASRTMAISGILVLMFVIFHLLHYTVGAIDSDLMLVKDATGRHDVYAMLVKGFSSPIVSGWYILCMALLSSHLSHGFFSLFQTLGLNDPKNDGKIKLVSGLIAIFIFLGYSSVPVAVLAGILKYPY
ncbi:MAG: succinate dehydrogenase cytochrome b subunit [Leptospiraceae bacterium]|nr:succinate dehydrogenase cytochrome b subunit [Leptospiraceae bacterium]